MSTNNTRSRRTFLRTLTRSSAMAVGVMTLPTALSETFVEKAHGTEILKTYPRVRIGTLQELSNGQPQTFSYPDDGHMNMLVKVGQPAQGGVGPDEDIVAFSTACPHMGCGMVTNHSSEKPVILGPCPCHFSCFDMSKGGMQIQGVASQDLPQVMLEMDGDTIYAIAIRGLIYGRHCNL